MKTLKNQVTFVFTLFLGIMAVIFFSTLQAVENGNFTGKDDRQTLIEEKLEEMRSQIRLNGWTFEVGDTPVLPERFDLFCHTAVNPESCAPPESMETASISAVIVNPARSLKCVATPVKNGGAGNGWAWASTAMFEKTIKLTTGVTVSLSEAWLIDCNPYGWDAYNGWFASDIFFRDGAVLSSGYTGNCTGVPISFQARGWRFCGNGYSVASTNSIKTAVRNYGAVACMVYVDYYFMAYTGGVFNHSSTADVNYFVIICGWDDNTNAWQITPSWGTGWGESGYMRIAYGCHRIGWAANYLLYP